MTTSTWKLTQTIFTRQIAGWLAYASAATLIVNIIVTITTGLNLFEFLGPLYRLLLIPAVFFLPSPSWAKMAGWLWILFDSALNIGVINGMDAALALQLRLGIHLAFGVWATAAAWVATGGLRWWGLATGIITAGYSFVAPWVSEIILISTLFLLIVFIILIGRYLHTMPIKNIPMED